MSRKTRLDWGVERSIRYHDRRVAFFESVNSTASFLSLLTGSAAIAALLKQAAIVAIVASAFSAATGFVSMTLRPASRAALHSRLRQRFCDLQIKLLRAGEGPDNQELDNLQEERLQIERDEPPALRMLDLLCHNELCQATDLEELWHVPWFKRATAHFVPWETNEVITVAEHKAKQLGLLGREPTCPFRNWAELVDAAKRGDEKAESFLLVYGPWVEEQLKRIPKA